jgi:hypothetical protein
MVFVRLLADSESTGADIRSDVNGVMNKMRSHHDAITHLYDETVGHAGTPSLRP